MSFSCSVIYSKCFCTALTIQKSIKFKGDLVATYISMYIMYVLIADEDLQVETSKFDKTIVLLRLI